MTIVNVRYAIEGHNSKLLGFFWNEAIQHNLTLLILVLLTGNNSLASEDEPPADKPKMERVPGPWKIKLVNERNAPSQ